MHIDAGGGDTLGAVIIGAVLATLGGFIATRFEAHLRRRERQRSAALLFGEVLSVIELLTSLADESRGRGDPYGGFTLRLTRALRAEIEVYDRNRESLYDLSDPAARARIHSLVARMMLTLEGFFDLTEEIKLAEAALGAMAADEPARAATSERLAVLREQRGQQFDFVVETAGDIKPVIAVVEKLAGRSFATYASIIRP
ncbi:MAG TPA: hypothetical protein VKU90_14600 [Caulobacteraceae bacterium]|nr:hypothetical protein [Caulobacteraceae bacterium]